MDQQQELKPVSHSEMIEGKEAANLEDQKYQLPLENISNDLDAVTVELNEQVNSNWKLSFGRKSFIGYTVLALLLFIFILPFLGSVLSSYSWSQRSEFPDPATISVNQNIPIKINIDNKDQTLDRHVNQRTLAAIVEARNTAEDFASRDLDTWLNELKIRVDGDFLDWYYGYFNQKRREILALLRGLTFQNISEKEFQDFNKQFTSRVVSPEEIETRLEVLTNEVVNLYAIELSKKLTTAQKDLKISPQQWNHYLDKISETVAKREPISGTAIAGTSIAGGYVLADALLSGTVSAFFEGQAIRSLAPIIAGLEPAAASALGVGAMGAVKLASKFAGPILGGGLIAYDLLSYSHRVAEEKPKLRERIFSNLELLKRSALTDVTTRINQLESNIRKSIDSVSITKLE